MQTDFPLRCCCPGICVPSKLSFWAHFVLVFSIPSIFFLCFLVPCGILSWLVFRQLLSARKNSSYIASCRTTQNFYGKNSRHRGITPGEIPGEVTFPVFFGRRIINPSLSLTKKLSCGGGTARRAIRQPKS